jgi:hypothetical protein
MSRLNKLVNIIILVDKRNAEISAEITRHGYTMRMKVGTTKVPSRTYGEGLHCGEEVVDAFFYWSLTKVDVMKQEST